MLLASTHLSGQLYSTNLPFQYHTLPLASYLRMDNRVGWVLRREENGQDVSRTVAATSRVVVSRHRSTTNRVAMTDRKARTLHIISSITLPWVLTLPWSNRAGPLSCPG